MLPSSETVIFLYYGTNFLSATLSRFFQDSGAPVKSVNANVLTSCPFSRSPLFLGFFLYSFRSTSLVGRCYQGFAFYSVNFLFLRVLGLSFSSPCSRLHVGFEPLLKLCLEASLLPPLHSLTPMRLFQFLFLCMSIFFMLASSLSSLCSAFFFPLEHFYPNFGVDNPRSLCPFSSC